MNRIISYFLCIVLIGSFVSASDKQGFEYEKELFFLNQTPDEFTQQSLTELLTEASKRKLMYDSLFDYVEKHGLDKDVLSIFSSISNDMQKSFAHITPQIATMHYLKSEFAQDRAIVEFYQRCLGRLIDDPNSIDLVLLQKLYDHTAHIVRLNLQSLFDAAYGYLSQNYPHHFSFTEDKRKKFVSGLGSLDTEEDDLYYEYVSKYYKVEDRYSFDTVQIWECANFLNKGKNYITSTLLIISINSIYFYLNIEKALLAICPDLTFDFSAHRTAKPSKEVRLMLTEIKDEQEHGVLADVLKSNVDEKTIENINKYSKSRDLQNRLIKSIKNFKSKAVERHFLDLFPQGGLNEEKSIEKQTTKQSKQKNKGNGKKKNNAKNKKQPKKKNKSTKKAIILKDDESDEEANESSSNLISTGSIEHTVNDFIESHGTTASKATTVLSTASSSVEPIDHIVAAFTNDNDAIPTTSNAQTSFSYKDVLLSPSPEQEAITVSEINFSSYQTTMSYNKYVYNRNVSARPSSSYTILGVEHKFNVNTSFEESFLKEVKSHTYIGIYKDFNNLPNLASYVLRIHYIIKGESELLTAEFSPQKKYISGAKLFQEKGLQYKNKNNIITAYNDFLNQEQKNSLREKQGKDFSSLLRKFMQTKLTTKISKGGFFSNSLDSEALLLLDLVDSMPNYVAQITKNWTTSVEVKGLALGIHSYRDCCWRCRNLIQGFQWSSDSLLQQISARAPTKGILTLSSDYASVVVVSGQIKPNSAANDFFPPAKVEETLVLGAVNSNDKSKHKFVAVSRKD